MALVEKGMISSSAHYEASPVRQQVSQQTDILMADEEGNEEDGIIL